MQHKLVGGVSPRPVSPCSSASTARSFVLLNVQPLHHNVYANVACCCYSLPHTSMRLIFGLLPPGERACCCEVMLFKVTS